MDDDNPINYVLDGLTWEEYSLLQSLLSKAFDMDRALHGGAFYEHPKVMRTLNTKVISAARVAT